VSFVVTNCNWLNLPKAIFTLPISLRPDKALQPAHRWRTPRPIVSNTSSMLFEIGHLFFGNTTAFVGALMNVAVESTQTDSPASHREILEQ